MNTSNLVLDLKSWLLGRADSGAPGVPAMCVMLQSVGMTFV